MATKTEIELRSVATHQQAQEGSDLADEPTSPARTNSTVPSTTPGLQIQRASPPPKLSKARLWIVLVQLCGINFVSSLSTGLLTICLPAIAHSLELPSGLLFWPTSVFSLASGSCLLIAGSITDVYGPRKVNALGSFFIAAFVLACGLAHSGIQLILFRAFHGIAAALFIPSAVSIVSTNIEHGKLRNTGFALILLAYPLGYGLGLALGGVFEDTVGWRIGFYIGGATGFLLFLVGLRTLPQDAVAPHGVLKRLWTEIDWIGALIASTSLSTLSYVLAKLSVNRTQIKHAPNIALLTLSLTLFAAFPAWMKFQKSRQKPALIPNALWKNAAFTSVCVVALLSNGAVTCMGLFSSLFFQKVQLLSAIDTSLRILPQIVVSTSICILAGRFIDKAPILATLIALTALCAVAPLLMALINPQWPYWYSAFWAQLLTPLSIDVTLTAGTLVVTELFPARTQALAGAVLNTFAQLGASIGMCILSVISTSVTDDSGNKNSTQALLKGYKASFWALFGCSMSACLIGGIGLRKLKKVGGKRE